MRNLAFLADGATEAAARQFREAFMETTATWSVTVQVCGGQDDAAEALSGRAHAFVAAPPFRRLFYEHSETCAASCLLAQGADVCYRSVEGTMALCQLARCVVDALEHRFLPLYGARVVLIGSGSAALDAAYELSRAGVAEVCLLSANKDRAASNLEAFLDAFDDRRRHIFDTEAAIEGHVSASRAYEQTSFYYGPLSLVSRIEAADLLIALPSRSDSLAASCIWPLRPSQIVCEPWGGSASALVQRADACGCDILAASDVMRAWGASCARLLTRDIELGHAVKAD